MKKLLTVLVSALMVLTVSMTAKVKAATGCWWYSVKYNVTGSETSNQADCVESGSEVELTAEDKDGYEFVNWEVKKFEGDRSNTTLTTSTDKTVKFTMVEYPNDGGVVAVANYKKAEPTIEPKSDDVVIENEDEKEGIIDVAEKEIGRELTDSDTVTYELVTKDVTADEEETVKTKVEELGLNAENVVVYNKSLKITVNNETVIEPTSGTTVTMVFKVGDIPAAASNMNRTWYVVRFHDGEEPEKIKAEFGHNGFGEEIITIENDKFSLFAISYEDTEKPATPAASGEHHVSCEELNNSNNWTWSESKGKCVYRVTNTSAK